MCHELVYDRHPTTVGQWSARCAGGPPCPSQRRIPHCNDASNATIEPRIEAVERKQSKAQQLLYERITDRAQGGNAPTVELFGWHNPAAPSPPVTAQQIEIHVHAHCTLGHQMATTQNPTDLH